MKLGLRIGAAAHTEWDDWGRLERESRPKAQPRVRDRRAVSHVVAEVLDVIPRLEGEPVERLHGVLRCILGARVPHYWSELVAEIADPEKLADIRAVLLAAMAILDRAGRDVHLLRRACRNTALAAKPT